MATLVLECSDLAGSSRLGMALQEHGHRLDVRLLHRGDEVPVDLEGIDAILSFGGPQSTNDDSLPWLQPQMNLLRAAQEAGVPVLGICLGSQILARALGGRVDRNEAGVRVGWHEIDLTPEGREDPLHRGLPWSMTQFHWNQDIVTELPPGARLLAKGPSGDVQTWAVGVSAYAVQHHPEIAREQVAQWIGDDDAGFMDRAGCTATELEAMTSRCFGDFERLTDRFFESIAMLLMPLDRRPMAMTAPDLHH